jgi:hypothetical protein
VGYAILENQRGANDPGTHQPPAWLAQLYDGWSKPDFAARYRWERTDVFQVYLSQS